MKRWLMRLLAFAWAWVEAAVMVCSTAAHAAPATPMAPTVIAVYPSAKQVPANVLRFYIRFSQPMQEMGILRHVHLQDAAGRDLSGVFFDNQYELWNPARTEVTLLLDPGRIKTGLRAHDALGWAFTPGKTYTLRVDAGLLNFRDQALQRDFVHRFTAVAADTSAPDPATWRVVPPKPHTRLVLQMDFQKSLHHIGATTLIQVLHNGQPVAGQVQLSEGERQWRFTPSKAWQPRLYQVRIAKQLEDVAGNSVLQVFDHPAAQYRVLDDAVILEFGL